MAPRQARGQAPSLPSKQDFLANLDPEPCPICYNDLTQPIRISCGHNFCAACAATWFQDKNTCPTCRKELYQRETEPEWEEEEDEVEMEMDDVLGRRPFGPAYGGPWGLPGRGPYLHGISPRVPSAVSISRRRGFAVSSAQPTIGNNVSDPDSARQWAENEWDRTVGANASLYSSVLSADSAQNDLSRLWETASLVSRRLDDREDLPADVLRRELARTSSPLEPERRADLRRWMPINSPRPQTQAREASPVSNSGLNRPWSRRAASPFPERTVDPAQLSRSASSVPSSTPAQTNTTIQGYPPPFDPDEFQDTRLQTRAPEQGTSREQPSIRPLSDEDAAQFERSTGASASEAWQYEISCPCVRCDDWRSTAAERARRTMN